MLILPRWKLTASKKAELGTLGRLPTITYCTLKIPLFCPWLVNGTNSTSELPHLKTPKNSVITRKIAKDLYTIAPGLQTDGNWWGGWTSSISTELPTTRRPPAYRCIANIKRDHISEGGRRSSAQWWVVSPWRTELEHFVRNIKIRTTENSIKHILYCRIWILLI